MVSRAMCNFGHERLVLIEPLCELDRTANKGAAQGQQPLRDCITYSSWEEYAEKEPDGPRIAYSRREGRRRPVYDINELVDWPPLTDGTLGAQNLHIRNTRPVKKPESFTRSNTSAFTTAKT